MSNVFLLKVSEIADKIRNSNLTSVDLCKSYIDQINKFEKDYKRTMRYQFINAFPKAMSSVPVSYGSAEILKVTVSFNYDRYIVRG